MFNVLIVDDQKQIRDGLQAMLRQFPLPIDGLHSAANGLEALELLRRQRIQLVITDIRMPDMDGLTLMERTREEGIKVDYLILSGYGDFAYAQRAIALGAKGYLLKPVKRDDLRAAVESAWEEIRARKELSLSMKHASRRARETDRKELRLFMQGAASDEDWMVRTEQNHPELWRSYRLVLLREERRASQPGAGDSQGAENAACQVYGKHGCLILQRQPQLVIAVKADIDPGALPAALQSSQIEAALAMTDPRQGLKELPGAYAQALELYRHSYLFPELSCLLPSHLERLDSQWQLPYEELYALFQQLGTSNGGRIAQDLSALFRKEALRRYPIRYTIQLCRAAVQMLEEYERVIRPYLGEEALDIECLRNLFDYPGIRDYIQALQRQLLRLNQFYYEYKCSYRHSQDLNEAIRFIHENYHRPLDLAMVSNHVSLNYAYFSNLFKKNVGKGFAEYLRDVRLDKARRLLAETDYKIVEIASMVGYENYKSFTRAFRDATDLQPTEYRERTRRREESEEEARGTAL
ncbi:response regulator [Cohnella fermenti]|uniref:Response regulator n=1 Tax=Cohnella fermenti TaxID=2565925 RepID=A0A4S4BPQ5_9BACL|nr:response regulator [Cohnella fermenti]THF76875.1 response regulator [Cohnella fermenti]